MIDIKKRASTLALSYLIIGSLFGSLLDARIHMRAYLLKMAVNGLIIRIDLDIVRKMNRLLSNATNNINQIAKRANETGSIYSADMEEIKARQDEIWVQQRAILKSLATIMDALQKRLPKYLVNALNRKYSLTDQTAESAINLSASRQKADA